MSVPRGLVPPAIITSAIVLILCSVGWGAIGVLSLPTTPTLPNALHRYLCLLLATLTISALVVNLAARLMRALRELQPDDGYATGYADGLDARPGAATSAPPAVSRLVRTPR